MKKAEMTENNRFCVACWNAIVEKVFTDGIASHYSGEVRLDYCTATVFSYGGYYWLRSYNTVIAVYDPNRDMTFDMLRYVYGYTATSAKHVAKFRNLHRSADHRKYYSI